MRVRTTKFRTKRVNKKRMTSAEIERANAKRQKFVMLDYWFDKDESADYAVATHLKRRYTIILNARVIQLLKIDLYLMKRSLLMNKHFGRSTGAWLS